MLPLDSTIASAFMMKNSAALLLVLLAVLLVVLLVALANEFLPENADWLTSGEGRILKNVSSSNMVLLSTEKCSVERF